jgi:hypothetical protein
MAEPQKKVSEMTVDEQLVHYKTNLSKSIKLNKLYEAKHIEYEKTINALKERLNNYEAGNIP